jgi:SAM-dependent methyltransferase
MANIAPDVGGLRVRMCPACLQPVQNFAKGPDGQPDRCCPSCGSLERHRFVALLLEGLAPAVASARLVLDIAPTEQTSVLFQRLNPTRYVRMDFEPGTDRRTVDLQASMTQMPFPDGSVDFAVCCHVLEHIPDDAAAMSELRRVLSGGGLALVQVPWRPHLMTDEDPQAAINDRIRRFGRADHVRYYGRDFEARLSRAGLSWLRITPLEVFGERAVQLFCLIPGEDMWVVRRGNGLPPRSFDATALRQTIMASLLDCLALDVSEDDPLFGILSAPLRDALNRASAAERRAELWEQRYQRLRGRLPVRLLAAAARASRSANSLINPLRRSS